MTPTIDRPAPGSPAGHLYGIDALRAVAVLSVIVFHLRPHWLPGGFTGVDVFFVISGFVVTMAAAKRPVTGFGAFASAFYARRVVRILPALVVCLVVTSCLSALFIPRAWLSDANELTALSAFFGVSNIVLRTAATNGYFAPRADFNPFVHTWSLGVEEQFYVLAPFLVYLYLRAVSRDARGDTRIAWLLAALCLLSLAGCAWLTHTRPQSAFYFVGSRFWELGVGVLLFLTAARWAPWLHRLSASRVRAIALAAGVVWGLALGFADARTFPFPWALSPVAATAACLMLVYARPGSGTSFDGPFGRALTWIGRASYSLYLWHWAVFALMRWTTGVEGTGHALVALALAFGLAAISYRWVEQPVRSAAYKRRPGNAVVIGCGVAVAVLGFLGTRQLFAEQGVVSLSVTKDAAVWRPESASFPSGWPVSCDVVVEAVSGPPQEQMFRPRDTACGDDKPTLFVIGDSHAEAYSGMLRAFAARSGWTVRVYSIGGCFFFNLLQPTSTLEPWCRSALPGIVRLVAERSRPGDVVFLASLRVQRYRDQWGDIVDAAPVTAQARSTSTEEAADFLVPLTRRGIMAMVDAPKPVFHAPPFRCADWFNRLNFDCARGSNELRSVIEARRAPTLASIAQLAEQVPGLVVWDPLPILCPGPTCSAWLDGRPLFFDGDHLSGLGNTRLSDSFYKAVTSASSSMREP